MINFVNAKDQMFAVANKVAVDHGIYVVWQNGIEKPPNGQVWARVSKRVVFEKQATIHTTSHDVGKKRYSTAGYLTIQLFSPRDSIDLVAEMESIAMAFRDALAGKSTEDHIWFKNVTIREIPPEDLYARINVVAQFTYETIS